MINSFILTTNQLILYRYCKEKIDVRNRLGVEWVEALKLNFWVAVLTEVYLV